MIEALSLALFHFLWQGAALALLPAASLGFRSPRVRYTAACAALFAMPLAFAVTFAISIPAAGSHVAIPIELHPAAAPSAPPGLGSRPVDLAHSLRWFVPFWALGVLLFSLRTCAAWLAVQRLRRASSLAAPVFWQHRLRELAERLGIRRAVALFGCELVDVPVVAGFLRPAIFVPAALFAGMPVEQFEYLLIHELAHVRRFDYAVNLLQQVVEGLLFYHPAVWWVSNILRTERENCCDDAVVAMRGNAREYAAVLASLESSRGAPAPAATGGHLGKRIMRLLNRPRRTGLAPVLGVFALAVCATVAWAALQQPSQPETALPQPASSFRKWVDEDVAYLITDRERAAYQALTSDAERERFIEQFWERRDPTPGTPENEFKEEHYRRIGYANAHFTANTLPGWKTDRGRIYITYGPPDEIDSHPLDPAPWEQWQYRWIEGIGNNVMLEFQDSAHNGEYPMTNDPNKWFRIDQTSSGIKIAIALDAAKNFNVFLRVTTMSRRPVTTSEKVVLRQASIEMPLDLKSGQYRVILLVKNADTGEVEIPGYERTVTVP